MNINLIKALFIGFCLNGIIHSESLELPGKKNDGVIENHPVVIISTMMFSEGLT